jgi:hypothetical protein
MDPIKEIVADKLFYSIALDPEKQRLYMDLRGFWASTTRVPEFKKDLQRAITRFKQKPFSVLMDLREFHPPLPEVTKLQLQCQKLMKDSGLLCSAGIVSEKPQQMVVEKYAEKADILMESFNDVTEAEKWLDTSVERLETNPNDAVPQQY